MCSHVHFILKPLPNPANDICIATAQAHLSKAVSVQAQCSSEANHIHI